MKKTKNKLMPFIMFVLSVLVAAAGGGYVWTEQQARARYDAYMLGAGKYQEINPVEYNQSTQQLPVFFSVNLGPGEKIKDPLFEVEAENAIILVRDVFMRQWVEKKGEDGKVASYRLEWSDAYHDSSAFLVMDKKYKNPERMFEPEKFFGKEPFLGAYKVLPAELDKLPESMYKKYPLPQEYLNSFPSDWRPRVFIDNHNLHIVPPGVQRGQAGEMMLYFRYIPAGLPVSVAGVQNGITILPVDKFEPGAQTRDELFDYPLKGIERDIWQYRGSAAVVMLLGIFGVFFMLRNLKISAGMLHGWGAFLATLLLWPLVCAQISKFYWPMLPDVVHQMNVISAVSGGLLLAHILIAFLRAFKNRRRAQMVEVKRAPAPSAPLSSSAPLPPPGGAQPSDNQQL